MATLVGSFQKTFRKLEKAVATSSAQALSRAATSTRSKYAKEISSTLGITSARAKSRAKIFKQGKTDIHLSIGVRTKLAAHDFKPKTMKVLSSKLGPRWAGTYQVKGGSRIKTDNGFLVYGKTSGKTLIIERKGKERYGTKTVMVDVFLPAVQKIEPALRAHMLETFKKNLDSQLKYNIDKI